jgi:hypothetical protein
MWSTRGLSHSGVHNFVRRAVYTKAVNHQSTSDYPRPPEETGKPPAGGTRIQTHSPPLHLSLSNRRRMGKIRRTLAPVGRGAGFSRFLLLAVGGGESHAADGPCPTAHQI